jgi:arylsulfatase A-like enzyme
VGDKMLSEQTLASLLSGRGYTTVGISAMTVAGPDQHLDRGFSSFEVHHDQSADELASFALDQAASVPANTPMFMWVHFADPHFPYLPPPRWTDQPKAEKCRALGEKASQGKLARYRLFSNRNGMATDVLDECTELYDAEIAFTDHAIGRLFAGLKEQGRPEPIVVFTADHGENLGEWDLFFEHGPNAHDASLRIPLVIAGPGVDPVRSKEAASIEDVTPTLLALLGGDWPGDLIFDGVDLLATGGTVPPRSWVRAESGSVLHARMVNHLVSGRKHRLHCIHGPQYSLCDHPKKPRRLFDRMTDPELRVDVLSEHPRQAEALAEAWKAWPVERTRQRLIRTSRFSLIDTPQFKGGYARALYEHGADGGMNKDVQADHPQVMAELAPELDRWHARLDAANQPVEARSKSEEEALRSLGYIE